MRQPNLLRLSIGTLLLATLSGCVPSDASTAPAPTSTFVAPYASDEEALAAAEEAYAEYTRVSLETYREGVTDPAALSSVASGEHLVELLEEFEERVADGRYLVGDESFDQVVLQRYSRDSSPNEVIAVYLCDDLSKLSIYRDGEKIGPKAPVSAMTMQVVFDLSPDSNTLLVSARDIWSTDAC
ncbi:hypothetical protein I6E81_02895 [Salinibacterium sp. NG22]|uniref:hypothetical protein n=1 Tax=Salinibacterium sp. NG22 TaxID=2792040 RepID=UPI0018CDAB92|nr:hypothetical protein [Salinibacterium sp. NG22]MBH0109110.1 hypothetical protein [Salinibacterium sp. NG22]